MIRPSILGIYLVITLSKTTGGWTHPINSPPILTVDRKWVVLDTEPINSVVTKARGSDAEGDDLEFGLEVGQSFNLNMGHSGPLPFTIDPKTGVVRTNQSLIGMAGTNMNVYVTVFDGSYTQKTGVWAVIEDSKRQGSDDSKAGRPKFDVPLQILPPVAGLTPIQIHPPPPPPHPPPPPPPPAKESSEDVSKHDKTSEEHQPSDSSSNADRVTTTRKSPPPITMGPTNPPPLPPSHPPRFAEIAMTVIPVTMVTIAFTVVFIAAFLFRRRICHPKKKKNKSSKKEGMSKKSSSGINGEEPMVLQHWRGPRATSNRYTAWDTDSSLAIPQQEAPSVPSFKPKDKWEFPRHQLKVFSILGEGCFGQVWKCEARDIIEGEPGPKIVAVKTLRENAGERERSDLVSELQVMKMLGPHPNVVQLLGCCTEKDPIFVIMEYVANGKLQSFLRDSRATRSYDNMHGKSDTLTSRQLTSFCYQSARGMEFLSNRGIIHRDLAARNVLVDTDHTCKVADFGFARDVVESHVYERKSEGQLPIRWMAPESLYDNVFSIKSDVWSFGVLIWEIVTLGSTPYPGLSAMEVMKRVKAGERLEKPEHCRRELYNIMYYCWEAEASKRPDFTELVDLLEKLLLSETDYIELQRFPDHSYYNMVSLSGEKV